MLNIGDSLRAMREYLGLTQNQIGKRMRASEKYVHYVEKSPTPTIATARKYAAALGVPYWQVIKHAEEHEQARSV